MGQKLLAQLLCIILAFSVPVPTSARDVPPAKPTIQEKVVLIQAGSIVEVKTNGKKKIQGRLLAVGNDSFDIQTAKGQTIDKQTFRFEDVRALSKSRRKVA